METIRWWRSEILKFITLLRLLLILSRRIAPHQRRRLMPRNTVLCSSPNSKSPAALWPCLGN
uniref:Uncharacterized protein n=1 Tax=Rhizophora mucronata TaxID=61149 RepID=A0A2P2K0M0_RHIMU